MIQYSRDVYDTLLDEFLIEYHRWNDKQNDLMLDSMTDNSTSEDDDEQVAKLVEAAEELREYFNHFAYTMTSEELAAYPEAEVLFVHKTMHKKY